MRIHFILQFSEIKRNGKTASLIARQVNAQTTCPVWDSEPLKDLKSCDTK